MDPDEVEGEEDMSDDKELHNGSDKGQGGGKY